MYLIIFVSFQGGHFDHFYGLDGHETMRHSKGNSMKIYLVASSSLSLTVFEKSDRKLGHFFAHPVYKAL